MILYLLLAKLGDGTGVATTEAGLGELIPTVFSMAATLGGFFMMYQMILGALNWINSAGEKEKVDKARKQITNAIIGMVILVIVWVLFFTITSDILGIFENLGGGKYQIQIPSLFSN